MEASDWVSIIVSIIAGIVVIIWGGISIFTSLQANQASRQNRRWAANYYEQTKDLLHKIDKRSSIMEQKLSENFQKPLDTQNNFINKAILPENFKLGKKSTDHQSLITMIEEMMESHEDMEYSKALPQEEQEEIDY